MASLTLTGPTAGATVNGIVSVTVSAPGVAKVNFYIDGVLKGRDQSAPFKFDWYTTNYPNGAHTVRAVSSSGKLADQVTVVIDNPVTPPPPPPPATGTGLGVLMYRGNLAACYHLGDGTYDLAIAGWKDPALATVSGQKFNYTVMVSTPGADQPGYVVFDPANPDTWLTQVMGLPAGQGAFIDNTVYGDNAPAGILAALEYVYPKLKAAGRPLCLNVGAFISGDSRSNDGSLWRLWASQLVPVADRLMMEHWQATNRFDGTGDKVRARGTAWYQQWDNYQLCPAVCQGKFVGITFSSIDNAIYARASLLLSGGAGVFIYDVSDGTTTGSSDSYDLRWAMSNPQPVVDPVAVTASL